ncbi:chorismate lyase [Aggregatibacter segnis]|uniref:chorismate lyase n=1 Tax=Aggregatibacter segnis TaxID=739 RepID=UPI0023B77B1F|nr:chorismate lyase [Aggregatibacter segnis]
MPDSIFARLTWQPEDAPEVQNIPFPIQHWLFEKGSLTARLKKRCHQFEVKVRSEKWIEKKHLKMRPHFCLGDFTGVMK